VEPRDQAIKAPKGVKRHLAAVNTVQEPAIADSPKADRAVPATGLAAVFVRHGKHP